jgi:hypothetical protein
MLQRVVMVVMVVMEQHPLSQVLLLHMLVVVAEIPMVELRVLAVQVVAALHEVLEPAAELLILAVAVAVAVEAPTARVGPAWLY